MKNTKLSLILVTLFVCLSTLNTLAQFQQTGAFQYLNTRPQTRAVMVGDYANPFGTVQSVFHINSNLTNNPAPLGFNRGKVFQTTGPANVDNTWRMFTGGGNGTERFVLFNPANTNDAVLQTTQNGAMRFATNGTTQRMLIRPGGTDNNAGRIALGNDLPMGFVPMDRLHLHQQNGGNTMIRFTNDNAIAGLRIGTQPNGAARIQQIDNNLIQMRTATGRLVMFGNNPPIGMPVGTIRIGPNNGGGNGASGVLQMPRLLVVGQNQQAGANGNYTVAEFRTNFNESSSTGIKIRGSRGTFGTFCTAHIEFANWDNNENGGSEHNMARIAADMQEEGGQTGYLEFYTNEGNMLTTKMLIDRTGNTGIGQNIFTVINLPTRRLDVLEGADIPQIRSTYTYDDIYTDLYTTSAGHYLIAPTNNRVGINMNGSGGAIGGVNQNPTRTLDVNGEARVRTLGATTIQTGMVIHENDGTLRSLPFSNDATTFLNGDGDFVVIQPTNTADPDWIASANPNNPPTAISDNLYTHGAVGVGLVSPNSKMHLHTTSFTPKGAKTCLQITNSVTGSSVNDGLKLCVFGNQDAMINQHENANLDFRTNNLNRVRIEAAGNVGINTISPNNKLEITSDGNSPQAAGLRFTNLTAVATTVTNPGTGVLTVDALGDVIYVAGGGGAETITTMVDNTDGTYTSEDGTQTIVDASGGSGTVTADNGLTINGANNVQLGQVNTSVGTLNGGELLHDTEMPLNGNNILFQGMGITGLNKFSIGEETAYSAKFYVGNDTEESTGIFTNRTGNTHSYPTGVYGETVDVSILGVTAYGVYGYSSPLLNVNKSNSYGVYGYAQNGLNQNVGVGAYADGTNAGRNYGIENIADAPLATNQNFAVRAVATDGDNVYGIYAEATGGASNTYAGYFVGDVYSTTGNYLGSDSLIKTNVQNLKNSLDVISSLRSKTFEYKTSTYPQMNLPTGIRAGLIAQEVEQILPNLVSSATHPAQFDSSGNQIAAEVLFKTLNYDGLIPYLICAIQEQQAEIDSLKAVNQSIDSLFAQMQQVKECINNLPPGMGCSPILRQANNGELNEERREAIEITLSDPRTIVLDQNTPNPFREQTTISWFVPENVGEAKIILINNNGTVIKEVNVEERGYGSMKVYAYDLSAGIYNYSLLVDGELIETKKMMRVK
ncbi:MAG: tail fiber domain-containing protein [Flavobacteriales bacterium]|nr:tail fiber domain-containing protein [Flavobacteriales bacterium]